MFDLISAAFAQTADQAPPAGGDLTSSLMRFMPLFLIFAVFYFLLIRPQQKKLNEHDAMIKALKKGDRVVTSGGLVGEITKLDGESYAIVEIAKGVEVKVVRATLSGLEPDKKTASTDSQKK